MSDLNNEMCDVCKKGAPTISLEEISKFMPQLPEWKIVEIDEIKRLSKSFKFDNLEQALQFTNKIGELCAQQNHHPSILTEWGSVTVTWWTHKINGLHMNDLIMSAKTDALISLIRH